MHIIPTQPAKRAKGRAQFTAKELHGVALAAIHKLERRDDGFRYKDTSPRLKCAMNAIADYVNAQSIGIAAPRKERGSR